MFWILTQAPQPLTLTLGLGQSFYHLVQGAFGLADGGQSGTVAGTGCPRLARQDRNAFLAPSNNSIEYP